MMRSNKFAYIFALLFLFSACKNGEKTAKNAFETMEGQAQGTTFRIVYESNAQASTDILAGEVDSLLRLMDKSMSAWDSSSIVTAWNQNCPGVQPDEHFIRVLKRGMEISEATNGAFDMTVGPLVRRWSISRKNKSVAIPTSEELADILLFVGAKNVQIVGQKVEKTSPEVQLDFNAIAQGYTVDLIAELLESKLVPNYMIELGGEVRTKGKNAQNQWWNIGIDKPEESEEGARVLQCAVRLQNQSLATSGTYRKFVEQDGKRYSHAIDPKTGLPVTHQLLSVSVLAPSCMDADAYATAFLVMGLEAAKSKAVELGMEIFCIFEQENGKLGVFASPGFACISEQTVQK